MSARHAVLFRLRYAWTVEDAGAKNGTFVNGQRLTSAWTLREGDILQCGSTFFVYREAAAPDDLPGTVAARACDAVVLSMPPLHCQIGSILPFANSELAIHLHGETGTGKEVVARALHDLSQRPGAFVARNCAAIPDGLFESELFGHAKGAFSGAVASRRGQVLEADKGTLFLDEIGELSLSAQAKLLRALELKEILPVGASASILVDFRLISATVCDLRARVAAGTFRKDLFGRLGQTFVLPPLRDHIESIGALMPVLLTTALMPHGGPPSRIRFSIRAARALVLHSWPFNIRELKQCVHGALTAASANSSTDGPLCIDAKHLPRSLFENTQGENISKSAPTTQEACSARVSRQPKHALSDRDIVAALQAAGGNRGRAARLLGVTERTVFRRIRKLDG